MRIPILGSGGTHGVPCGLLGASHAIRSGEPRAAALEGAGWKWTAARRRGVGVGDNDVRHCSSKSPRSRATSSWILVRKQGGLCRHGHAWDDATSIETRHCIPSEGKSLVRPAHRRVRRRIDSTHEDERTRFTLSLAMTRLLSYCTLLRATTALDTRRFKAEYIQGVGRRRLVEKSPGGVAPHCAPSTAMSNPCHSSWSCVLRRRGRVDGGGACEPYPRTAGNHVGQRHGRNRTTRAVCRCQGRAESVPCPAAKGPSGRSAFTNSGLIARRRSPPSRRPRRRDRTPRIGREGVRESDLPAQSSNRQSTRYRRRRQGLRPPDYARRESLTSSAAPHRAVPRSPSSKRSTHEERRY
jgi:hypothetical protein